MKIFIWRHNRKYHSWSMLEEPCVHQALYNDAVAVVLADSETEALAILSQEGGWLPEELKRLRPQSVELNEARLIFQDIRGE